jgi:putative oxidoreductase
MNLTDLSLLILQVGVGLTFAAHGAQKLFGWWDGPGMAGWQAAIQHMGFRPARLFAPLSAILELGGGLLLAAGLLTPLVAAALVAQAIVIIGSVHWSNGFFNARSGFEFPLLLGLGGAAIGLAGAGALSVDALIGLEIEPVIRAALVLGGTVAGLVTMLLPRLGAQRGPEAARNT